MQIVLKTLLMSGLAIVAMSSHAGLPFHVTSHHFECVPFTKSTPMGKSRFKAQTNATNPTWWPIVGLRVKDTVTNNVVLNASTIAATYVSAPISLVAGRAYSIEYINNNDPLQVINASKNYQANALDCGPKRASVGSTIPRNSLTVPVLTPSLGMTAVEVSLPAAITKTQ